MSENLQSSAPSAQDMVKLGNKLAGPTRTYITRADRDVIRLALEDFQNILHELGSTDSLDATGKVKSMARKFTGQYKVLFDRVCHLVGNVDNINVEDVEISMNPTPVNIDAI